MYLIFLSCFLTMVGSLWTIALDVKFAAVACPCGSTPALLLLALFVLAAASFIPPFFRGASAWSTLAFVLAFLVPSRMLAR